MKRYIPVERVTQKLDRTTRKVVKRETKQFWRKYMLQISKKSFWERARLAWRILWARR